MKSNAPKIAVSKSYLEIDGKTYILDKQEHKQMLNKLKSICTTYEMQEIELENSGIKLQLLRSYIFKFYHLTILLNQVLNINWLGV